VVVDRQLGPRRVEQPQDGVHRHAAGRQVDRSRHRVSCRHGEAVEVDVQVAVGPVADVLGVVEGQARGGAQRDRERVRQGVYVVEVERQLVVAGGAGGAAAANRRVVSEVAVARVLYVIIAPGRESTLFPYTTLFRSVVVDRQLGPRRVEQPQDGVH